MGFFDSLVNYFPNIPYQVGRATYGALGSVLGVNEPEEPLDPRVSNKLNLEKLGITEQDIKDFSKTSKGKGYEKINGVWSIDDKIYSAKGENITDIFNNLKSFVAGRKEDKKNMAAYRAEMKDHPGQSANILSSLNQPVAKTILGQSEGVDLKKTVLG